MLEYVDLLDYNTVYFFTLSPADQNKLTFRNHAANYFYYRCYLKSQYYSRKFWFQKKELYSLQNMPLFNLVSKYSQHVILPGFIVCLPGN